MTKTSAKTLASSAATASGSDLEAAPKSRAKPASKAPSAVDDAASSPLKKPSAKAEPQTMNAAKTADPKLANAWKTKAGKDYSNSYCFVLRLADGRLTELREYLDTALVEKVFG